jgi:hypothetical protein
MASGGQEKTLEIRKLLMPQFVIASGAKQSSPHRWIASSLRSSQ